MTEYTHEADVQSVTVKRTADGEIQALSWSAPIEVRANYFIVDKGEHPEEHEIKNSWEARFRYDVVDGVAVAVQAKDIEGSDCHSNWQGFGYLRILPVVENAVANVEGVEEVDRIEETIGTIIEAGRDAEFNPE